MRARLRCGWRGPSIGLMLLWMLIARTAMPAEPTGDEQKLLQRFRGEFIELTPGKDDYPAEFMMGRDDGEPNEGPRHRVGIERPFSIARYEVTQELWQLVMGDNPSRWRGPRNSVEMLTFDQAVEFCRRVTQRLRAAKLIAADQVVRLPSEAEWEYAARAGTTSRYSFGDDEAQLNDYAWSTHNAAGNDPPVGAKKPNAWGLYDVHGYLWEWCADAWQANYRGAPADGSARTAPDNAAQRVLRGGSWKDPAARLTSTFRRAAAADSKDDAVGLRCVLAREEQQ